jgi:hypothetical protein
MTRLTRTVVLAAASVGLVTAAAASSVAAGAATSSDVRYVKMARELTAIATWSQQHGLSGLSPASLHPVSVAAPKVSAQNARDVFAALPRYSRDVFADIP